MIALLQRVTQAQVDVDGQTIARIGKGLLIFIGVERADGEAQAEWLVERLLNYRVFADAAGKMNLGLRDIDGELLLVPQFTLAADTHRGLRPSFTPAAETAKGAEMFDYLLRRAQHLHERVGSGLFGADMQVSLINDGPVTFLLRTNQAKEEGDDR
ncbi:MAG TPA: D-aminoacyl-tRNA deacylase [Gammaproteobacteria bacterium]|nr:D-aminoacyl-tRNA deacylase [Gammaproteobacteria bacterium]